MGRPRKPLPGQPKLTKRQRAVLEALVVWDKLRRSDVVDELNDLVGMGLLVLDYEGTGEPTAAGKALVQFENVEPEPTAVRDYEGDAQALAGAVVGFIDQIMNAEGSISNDHAHYLQLARDVLAGKPEEL